MVMVCCWAYHIAGNTLHHSRFEIVKEVALVKSHWHCSWQSQLVDHVFLEVTSKVWHFYEKNGITKTCWTLKGLWTVMNLCSWNYLYGRIRNNNSIWVLWPNGVNLGHWLNYAQFMKGLHWGPHIPITLLQTYLQVWVWYIIYIYKII